MRPAAAAMASVSIVLAAVVPASAHATLLSGDPKPTAMPTESGRPHDVYRCPTCGTAVWSDYGRRPALRFVRVGTLDEPAKLPPDVHIFTRSKLPWVALPERTPAFELFYDVATLWPAASFASWVTSRMVCPRWLSSTRSPIT